jgi:hypothetical protein
MQVKQVQKKTDQVRSLKTNSDGKTLGYERINQLTALLKQEEQKTEALQMDVKAMKRINSSQNEEILKIEDTKGYNAKIEQLLNELQASNAKNEELRH